MAIKHFVFNMIVTDLVDQTVLMKFQENLTEHVCWEMENLPLIFCHLTHVSKRKEL